MQSMRSIMNTSSVYLPYTDLELSYIVFYCNAIRLMPSGGKACALSQTKNGPF